MLLGLTSDDLKDIGIASLGHRKKLLEAIAALGADPSSVAAVPAAEPTAPARQPDAECREGQVVLLTGEVSIGKSRITEALVEAVVSEPHFLLRYQCSPYNADSTLYPVIQHLAYAAAFAAEDAPERRLAATLAADAAGHADFVGR